MKTQSVCNTGSLAVAIFHLRLTLELVATAMLFFDFPGDFVKACFHGPVDRASTTDERQSYGLDAILSSRTPICDNVLQTSTRPQHTIKSAQLHLRNPSTQPTSLFQGLASLALQYASSSSL